MNSKERHERRYWRRKAKRHKYGQNITIEKVYTMQNLQRAAAKCKRGVMWKENPIRYTTHAVVNNKRIKDNILAGNAPECHGIRTAIIYERGKQRELHMVNFADRVPQKCQCDYALSPGLLPSVIYDNCSSQKNKGTAFCRKRVIRHLQRAVYKYGVDNTYVLTVDLKQFFKSIPHKLCQQTMRKVFSDERVIDLTLEYIKMYHEPEIDKIRDAEERSRRIEQFKENRGIGCTLGSEISQTMSIVVLNPLDHAMKEAIGTYERYNDDIIVFGTEKQLAEIYRIMRRMVKELGLSFNEKKTKIQKVTRPFVFLKTRYRVTNSGEIVRQCSKGNVVQYRRKLKRFKRRVERGAMKLDDVFQSMQSWLGHLKGMKAWHVKKNMVRRYKSLFEGYRFDELAV